MPQRANYHEPDAIDCYSMAQAIGEDFGLLLDVTTGYQLDQVVVLVRAYAPDGKLERTVIVQAMCRRPVKTAKSLWQMQYAAMLDCWHQLDRGVLAAETRPIERGWDGRPRTPRRSNR